MSLNSFSTGFVFIGIGILAIAIIALVIWITVLSSRLKRVTDALMAHPELEHAAAAGHEGDVIVEDASAQVASGAAYEGIEEPGAMGSANTAVMGGIEADLAQQQAEAQAMALAEAHNAAEAQAAEMQAAQHYAAIQQRAAAAQQAAYGGTPYAQQQAAGYPYAGNAAGPYAGQQAASAGAQSPEAAQQQALNAARAQGAAQNAMTPAQQQAALAQQAAAMHHMAAQNGSTFFDQRQPHDDGYSFDEAASDFFEGYRDSAGRQEKSFGRNTPLIPMGADRDVIEKRESYAEGALGGEYDLDSIDFSKVAGYRHPQR